MVSFVRAPRVLEAPPEVPLDSSQRAIVHMAASLLLDYPAEGSLETRLNAVEAELAALPPEVAVLLEEFIAQARRRGERAMAEHYVEVFDRRRRCCLYLTYYTVGDTRHRGAADRRGHRRACARPRGGRSAHRDRRCHRHPALPHRSRAQPEPVRFAHSAGSRTGRRPFPLTSSQESMT